MTTATPAITTDSTQSIEFLRLFSPNGPWNVASIPTEGGKPTPGYYTGSSEYHLARWIEAHGQSENIYFVPNVAGPAPSSGKHSETDIVAVRVFFVDLDPPAGVSAEEFRVDAVRRLTEDVPAGVPGPASIVVDSGGGVWGFWLLAEPYAVDGDTELIAKAKGRNAALQRAYEADSTPDLCRLARLVGTINRPDKRKQAKRRERRVASLIFADPTMLYRFDEFDSDRAAIPNVSALTPAQVAGAPPLKDGVNDPRLADVSDFCKVVIVYGKHPDEPKRFVKKEGSDEHDRSRAVMYVACELVRAGVDNETIYQVLTDPKLGISDSVLEKGRRASRYATRQIEKARLELDQDRCDLNFEVDKNGRPYPSRQNVRVCLNKLGVSVTHDEFADRSLIDGLDGFGPTLDDKALARLWLMCEELHRLNVGREKFCTIVADLALDNRRHPVREFLDSLEWDGTRRLDRWLVDYLGAAESEYTRAVGSIVLIAAVRRVRQPGVKFDELLVLEGAQGGGKSSALRTLAVREDWFCDDIPLTGDSKRVIEQLSGKWICEAGELAGLRKADVDTLKAFLSRQVDRARLAYGRLTSEHPRQSIVVGSTNLDEYLRDPTGARRFWPVRCGRIDLEAIRRDRDQLWAEAARVEAEGASIRLDPALYSAAAEQAGSREKLNPMVEPLSELLADLNGKVTAADLWRAMGLSEGGKRTQAQNDDFGVAMRKLGWQRDKAWVSGRTRAVWVRGDGPVLTLTGDTDDGFELIAPIGNYGTVKS